MKQELRIKNKIKSAGRNKIFGVSVSSYQVLLTVKTFPRSLAKKIFIPTSACILLLSLTQTAHAQTVSLGVYPPILRITVNPPASMSQGIVLKNFMDNPLSVQVVFRAFKNSPSNDGELTYFPPNQPIPGNDPKIFDKIQLYDGDHVASVINLLPQEAKTLSLHIGLPQDEPPSDYYFSILFITQGVGNDQSNVSAIAGGIGTNVLLSIGPQTATNGFIKEFSTPPLIQHGPVSFTLSVENTSTHFINPTGTIVIENMFGQFVGKLNLTPVNILEHSARFIPDDNNINGTKAIWPEKVLFGPYKAKLTIALSTTGPLFTRTIYFFALPTEALLGFILTIILGVIIYLRVRQRLKKM